MSNKMTPERLEQLLIKLSKDRGLTVHIRSSKDYSHRAAIRIITNGRYAKIICLHQVGYQYQLTDELDDRGVGIRALAKGWLAAGTYVERIDDLWGRILHQTPIYRA